MTSQLNVDTIVDKAGSGGTNVKISTASTYVSEGGAKTQNAVQGIAKAWLSFDGTSTAHIDDSFNFASVTDEGTGDYIITFTNAMNTADYSHTNGSTSPSGQSIGIRQPLTMSATQVSFETYYATTQADFGNVSSTIHGDLA